jgi:murein L,D-transpeptidase YafK
VQLAASADDALAASVCAVEIAAGRLVPRADRVLVEKGARRLTLWFAGYRMREYRVALGSDPIGDKQRIGDGRTPEGLYSIDGRNGASEFYRSLHISYPNAADLRSAREAGAHPGGEIMIHGLPEGAEWVSGEHTRFDWTEGCIAVTNEEIDELWELVADGTPIEIRP